MKALLCLILCLCAYSSAICQTTSPSPSKPKPFGTEMVCLDPKQAAVIWKSLQQFVALKPEVRALRTAVDTLQAQVATVTTQRDLDRSAAASYRQALSLQERLTVDADSRAEVYKLKARRRGWRSAGLAVLLVVVTGLAVGR